MENNVLNTFRTHMESAGVPLRKTETGSRPEKTASASVEDMQAVFLAKAEKAIMSEALAEMWNDPILGNLLDNGEIKTASKLAAGRFVDTATAEKIASLSVEDAHELADRKLQSLLQEKIASLPQDEIPISTHFPSIFTV